MKQELICITCPIGCHLCVDLNTDHEVVSVHGNNCPRGEVYARQEVTRPQRMLTSTIKIEHAIYPLLPIMTSATIPKGMMFQVMEELSAIQVSAPIKYRQIIKENIAGTGVNILASRSMGEYNGK